MCVCGLKRAASPRAQRSSTARTYPPEERAHVDIDSPQWRGTAHSHRVAERAQAVQDWRLESLCARGGRVDVQRIVVAAEAVEPRLR